MSTISRLKDIATDANAKIATLSEGIEEAENKFHWDEATGLLQERDDLIAETYEEIAGIIEDAEPEKLLIVTLISEKNLADAPSVYVDRTWEGIREKLLTEWSFIVGTELAEWGPDELAAHFEACGFPIDIIETEIPA